MDLTPSEIKYVEKSIQRLEKDSRRWPYMRWFMIVASFVIIGISIYSSNQLVDFNDFLSDTFLISHSFDSKSVELFVKAQVLKSQSEIYNMLRIGTQELIGMIWLAYCLIHWNRHLKSAIMAKALSRLLSEK